MWLLVALVAAGVGAALTAAGLAAGRRGDERAQFLFVGGVALFAAGTLALAIALLVG